MAGIIKYSKQQRERVYKLFWIGRDIHIPNSRGKYTCKQISEMTGVSPNMVYCIAKGLR